MLRSRLVIMAGLAVFSSMAASIQADAQIWTPPPPPPPPPPPSPPPAIAASSSGAALSVEFEVNGKVSSLANQVYASGFGAAAYNKNAAAANYAKSAKLAGGWTLTANGKQLKTTAVSPATTSAGSRTATGTASLGTLTIKLELAGKPADTMTITTGNLHSTASFTANKAGAHTSKGTISIGHLAINAPAWGIKNVIHNGSTLPNKVLFKKPDGSLIIYANYQVVASSGGKPANIMVDTVDIHLTNFKLNGQTLTGDIQIGRTTAS